MPIGGGTAVIHKVATMKRGVLLSVCLAVLLAGCGGDDASRAAADPNLFRVAPDEAKIFFYVTYNSPDDEPFLGEVFRLRIDNGYVQQIDEGEFISIPVTPEEHTIDVEEVLWSGNIESHTTLKERFKAGAASFLMERVAADQKPALMNIDSLSAMPQIRARKRVCNCGTTIF